MIGAAQVTKGRPRKPNVIRDRSGKSRGEPERIDPVRLAYRARDLRRAGFRPRDASDQAANSLAGSTLGQLLLRHQISPWAVDSIEPRQYGAGLRFARMIREHARIMGYSLGGLKALQFIRIGAGKDCIPDATEDEIIDIRASYCACYDVLAEASKFHGSNVQYATYAVCVQDRPLSALTTADYGALRIGLNVLARALR